MICGNCGEKNSGGNMFCVRCGAALTNPGPSPTKKRSPNKVLLLGFVMVLALGVSLSAFAMLSPGTNKAASYLEDASSNVDLAKTAIDFVSALYGHDFSQQSNSEILSLALTNEALSSLKESDEGYDMFVRIARSLCADGETYREIVGEPKAELKDEHTCRVTVPYRLKRSNATSHSEANSRALPGSLPLEEPYHAGDIDPETVASDSTSSEDRGEDSSNQPAQPVSTNEPNVEELNTGQTQPIEEGPGTNKTIPMYSESIGSGNNGSDESSKSASDNSAADNPTSSSSDSSTETSTDNGDKSGLPDEINTASEASNSPGEVIIGSEGDPQPNADSNESDSQTDVLDDDEQLQDVWEVNLDEEGMVEGVELVEDGGNGGSAENETEPAEKAPSPDDAQGCMPVLIQLLGFEERRR